MKAAIVSLLAIASLVAAQNDDQSEGQGIASALGSLPQCSLDCFQQALSQSGCELTDIECQCTTGAPKIAQALGPCLCQSTCVPGDFEKIGNFSDQMCRTAVDNYKPRRAGLDPSACSSSASSASGASSTAAGGVLVSGAPPRTRPATTTDTASTASPTGSDNGSATATGATLVTAQATSTGTNPDGVASNTSSNSTSGASGSTTQLGTDGTPTTVAGGSSRIAGQVVMVGLFAIGLVAL